MKIANIDTESLHILWTTSKMSMKFSEKMWLMIILKVTENQDCTLSSKDTFLEKPQGMGMGVQIYSCSHQHPSSLGIFRVNIWNTVILRDVVVRKADIKTLNINLNYCVSALLLYLVRLSGLIYAIAFNIEKVFWVHFSWHIFLLLKTLWHVLIKNLGKTKLWVSVFLNLILHWWFSKP